MSTKQAFCALKKPPLVRYKPHKPAYYQDNGQNTIFIPADGLHMEDIIHYDMDKQQIIAKYKYPGIGDIDEIAINSEGKLVCIMTNNVDIPLVSLDLNAKKWNELLFNQGNKICCVPNDEYFPQTLYIPSPINEFHLTYKNIHYRYDDTNIITKLHTGQSNITEEDVWKSIYCKQLQMLMRFVVKSRDILICNITHKRQETVNWRRYKTEYHKEIDIAGCYREWDVILAWDQVVFWFKYHSDYVPETDGEEEIILIFCLDLLHNDKWYKSHVQFSVADVYPKWVETPYAIKDNDDNIHIMSFNKVKDKDYNYHHRASLYDIVPKEIVQLNRQRWNPLIHGFVKQFEKRNKMIFLPSYLKNLILHFYPIFL